MQIVEKPRRTFRERLMNWVRAIPGEIKILRYRIREWRRNYGCG